VFGDLGHAIEKLAKVAFPWNERIKVLIDVADAMAYCHRQTPPIAHRDLVRICVVVLLILSFVQLTHCIKEISKHLFDVNKGIRLDCVVVYTYNK
jgi:hypothetical protein